ncbi:MAG: DUF2127 domain-containing protein [Polyangiaceae bacterium]
MTKPKSSVGLRIIAIGKLFKVVTLLTVGILAIALASGGDPPEAFRHWIEALQIDEKGRLIHAALSKISGVEPRKLAELGIGSFAYAALFAVEGIGLWLEKRWAEYLTIAITLSFIPLEIHEIAKHVTTPRIVMLVLNVAVLGYLLVRVRSEGSGGRLKKAFTSPRALYDFMLRR